MEITTVPAKLPIVWISTMAPCSPASTSVPFGTHYVIQGALEYDKVLDAAFLLESLASDGAWASWSTIKYWIPLAHNTSLCNAILTRHA